MSTGCHGEDSWRRETVHYEGIKKLDCRNEENIDVLIKYFCLMNIRILDFF